jgi:hypothetical protein
MDRVSPESNQLPEFDPDRQFRRLLRGWPRPRSAYERERNIRRAIRFIDYDLAQWEKSTGSSSERHRARLLEIQRSALQRRSILSRLGQILRGFRHT